MLASVSEALYTDFCSSVHPSLFYSVPCHPWYVCTIHIYNLFTIQSLASMITLFCHALNMHTDSCRRCSVFFTRWKSPTLCLCWIGRWARVVLAGWGFFSILKLFDLDSSSCFAPVLRGMGFRYAFCTTPFFRQALWDTFASLDPSQSAPSSFTGRRNDMLQEQSWQDVWASRVFGTVPWQPSFFFFPWLVLNQTVAVASLFEDLVLRGL